MTTHTTPYNHYVIDGFMNPDRFDEVQTLFKSLVQHGEWELLNDEAQHDIARCHDGEKDDSMARLKEIMRDTLLKEQVYTHVLDKGCSFVNDNDSVRTSLLSMGPGSSIDRHVDFGSVEEGVVHVNALLYVHDAWEENAWGGELLMHGGNSDSDVRRYTPLPNRLVVFVSDERSFHEVAEVRCPADVFRRSVMTYVKFRRGEGVV